MCQPQDYITNVSGRRAVREEESKVYSIAASSLQHKTMLTERIALLQQMLLLTMKVALV